MLITVLTLPKGRMTRRVDVVMFVMRSEEWTKGLYYVVMMFVMRPGEWSEGLYLWCSWCARGWLARRSAYQCVNDDGSRRCTFAVLSKMMTRAVVLVSMAELSAVLLTLVLSVRRRCVRYKPKFSHWKDLVEYRDEWHLVRSERRCLMNIFTLERIGGWWFTNGEILARGGPTKFFLYFILQIVHTNINYCGFFAPS